MRALELLCPKAETGEGSRTHHARGTCWKFREKMLFRTGGWTRARRTASRGGLLHLGS